MSASIQDIIDISTSSSDRSPSPAPVKFSQAPPDNASSIFVQQQHDVEPPTAMSRVSLANLLGPDGPGSSPHPNSPRTSPRKRLSDASRPEQSPPYKRQQTNGASHDETPRRITPSQIAGPSRLETQVVKTEDPRLKQHAAENGVAQDAVMTEARENDQAEDGGQNDAGDDGDDDDDEDDDSASDAGSSSEREGEASKPADENAPDAAEPVADGDAAAASKKRSRRRSPSLEAPQGPPPPKRPTVRLSILGAKQGGYMINVPELVLANLKSKDHPWAKWYEEQLEAAEPEPEPTVPPATAGNHPDLEGFGGLAKLLAKYPTAEDGAPADGAAASKKRRRPNQEDKYDIGQYDVRDPFVDDSELNIDEPTHFAKPKADGFYVTKGTVELAKSKGAVQAQTQAAKEKVKPLSIRDSKQGFAGSINRLIARKAQQESGLPPMPAPSASMNVDALLNTTPTPSDNRTASVLTNASQMDGTRESPIKVDDVDSKGKSAKKANRYPTLPVDPRLQSAFDDLKRAVEQESFAVKTKFPATLKPPLIETAKLAVMLGQYDDNFFNHLPTIFPYNRFTMMKLVKREFFPHHIKYFEDLKQEHLDKLGRMLHDALPMQKAEFEAAHQTWVERGEVPREADPVQPADPVGEAMDVDGQKTAEEESAEPVKRWRWTEDMREEVFVLITIENAMSEVRNEKLKLENSVEQYSEINARKACYKQMAELFPEDGWTTSTNISREYAQLKKKKDRQEARGEDVFADSRASSVMPS